ncbi:pyridoxamine 5'-phosphate oxidase family protein [Heliophilum fasciatum]|uniref:Pyridoxamine 5'-phosphate oxidase n=1 Tax=Heliophilum fasciatum TaxID=35700 RepID=A0A4R2RJL0_9FIRM|nr:pyridoxamine 5'-phosphate oxidase family protein [Heliophilum fasciatum]TCP62709.1 pyridoxamine 5'-phosphate oxidase [Heliophilum fasciatum]
MTLKAYFEQTNGLGILSTANEQGEVNAAIYAKPHFMEDGTVGFIMRERLTYQNVLANPKACYLFVEAPKMAGYRLYLTKVGVEADDAKAQEIRRRCYADELNAEGPIHLVYFQVDRTLKLLGGEEVTTCPRHQA